MKTTKLFMGTVVAITIHSSAPKEKQQEKVERAFEAFRNVENACSRFSPDSELIIACSQVQCWVPISPFLYQPLHFALEMAKWTDGLFDPTVGRQMEEHGFNRHYLTRQEMNSQAAERVSYRDVILDDQTHSLYLGKPLVLDLGAVAKGFAIDLAARELSSFEGYVVNAGGDLFAGGVDEQGKPWKIGIQHPVDKESVIYTLTVSNQAVCTSGNYERQGHLIRPMERTTPHHLLSASVVAPYAMMADAMATVSFLKTPDEAESFIREADVEAVLIRSDLTIQTIGGIC